MLAGCEVFLSNAYIRDLYTAIKEKISIAELLNHTFQQDTDVDLMNLVMQFRKVCNHPELFERAEYRSAFVHDPFCFKLPTLLFNDMEGMQAKYGVPEVPTEWAQPELTIALNPFDPYRIHRTLFPTTTNPALPQIFSSFSFLRFIGMSATQFQR